MSCAAACIRQLAKDNGIEISENIIRTELNTDFVTGTQLDNQRIKKVLIKIFNEKNISSGTIDIGIDDMKKTAEVISDVIKKPWIATLKPPGKLRHTIIVDKIEDGIVYIRDPWDKVGGFGQKYGVEASMSLDDFEYFWRGSRYHSIIIK